MKSQGVNGFKPFKAIWDEHPDRDEQWSKEERTRVGEERFLREHECQFIAFDETLVDSIKLSHLKGIEPIHKTGQVRWYEKINKDSTYVVDFDPNGNRRRLFSY